MIEKVRFRDQFFMALRGKASASGKDLNVDLELAVADPDKARLEFSGPLGIRLGMLLMNSDWVQLYVPREKTVYRFPVAELSNDTLRRQRFLELLPLPVVPAAFFDALLTRVALPKNLSYQVLQPTREAQGFCESDHEAGAYRIRVPTPNGFGGRWVWVDPESFAPVRALYFDRNLPLVLRGHERPTVELKFSDFKGAAASTLPTHVQVFSEGKEVLNFQWAAAERWESYDPSVFEWRPAASMTVKDY